MSRSCEDCKFFDAGNIVCMYDARSRSILDEDKAARECEYYIEGEYDEEELELTSYK